VPGFGVAGAGIAMIVFNVAAGTALALYLRSRGSALRLAPARLERRLFAQILRVGFPSAIGTIVANLTVVVTTGLVAGSGRDAIAGYGLASRLDYLLIPLLFALGTACVTMVGTNVGAGRGARAWRIAWTSAAISALAVGAIGAAAALFPQEWVGLFSREPEVLRVGSEYLRRVAPFYPFVGLGMALYFASQGAGRMAWPFSAGVARLAVVLLAGTWWMHAHGGALAGLFWIAAFAQVLFGAVNVAGMIVASRALRRAARDVPAPLRQPA
jgi:Na+-driven multidrug efflux pump